MIGIVRLDTTGENASVRDKKSLSELKEAMQNDDDRFSKSIIPNQEVVARIETVAVDVLYKAQLASAEILWAQKYNHKSGNMAARPVAAYTICYCCGEKGHSVRDCYELATARCTFCSKIGHKEVVCRQKQRFAENKNARGSGTQHGEAPFFHGRQAECNVISFGSMIHARVSSGLPVFECSGSQDLQIEETIPQFEFSDKWLADNGASHHICPDESKVTSMAECTTISSIQTLHGSMQVTKVGTVKLFVDGQDGKEVMVLENILFQLESKWHIYSLQQATQQNCYYTFGQASKGKIRLMQQLSTSSTRQVALLSKNLGKWTLDVHPRPKTSLATTVIKLPSISSPIYLIMSKPTCCTAILGVHLLPLDNSFSDRFAVHRGLDLPSSQLPHGGVALQEERKKSSSVSTVILQAVALVLPHFFVDGGALGKSMHQAIHRAHVLAETSPLDSVDSFNADEVVDSMAVLVTTDLVLLPTGAIHVCALTGCAGCDGSAR